MEMKRRRVAERICYSFLLENNYNRKEDKHEESRLGGADQVFKK
jgi:hypothetical protein